MKLSLLLVLFSLSTFASDRSVRFFFSEARGTQCSQAQAVYEKLEDINIHEVGHYSFDITGHSAKDERLLIKLRTIVTRGSGGFGPSGWIYSYTCTVEEY